MLTLFRPWRTGADLKDEDVSFEDEFNKYNFLPEHVRVMDNFHLRYECLDSRDDFRKEQRDLPSIVQPSWLEVEPDAIDRYNDIDDMDTRQSNEQLQVEVNELLIPSSRVSRRLEETRAMKQLLISAGWASVAKPANGASFFAVDPGPDIPHCAPSFWSNLITQERKSIAMERLQCNIASNPGTIRREHVPLFNGVKIVDKSYLERSFIPSSGLAAQESVSKQFCLNPEQDRAFRLVTNHVETPSADQLLMYIGGMGGTGKSQVLKALLEFFRLRGESSRILVVAPTGNAAVIIGGQTYHSAFGITQKDGPPSAMADLKDRLKLIDYIFFDEISMCSCRDLYAICAKLVHITGNVAPFGGKNMLFAGDFAQLPPPVGGESVSLYSDQLRYASKTNRTQLATLGLVLWHMVTTVVILRQNMRQTSQSPKDAKYRTMLENLRYGRCTARDVALVRSLVSSSYKGGRSISDSTFRNAAIITGNNSNKDAFNELGRQRFAGEHGMDLQSFYCEDLIALEDETATASRVRRKQKKKVRLSKMLQEALWEQPVSSVARKIPAKLMICKGMPVIILDNVSTDHCMVNGQRGTVYGWHEGTGSYGQRVLETLFVTLDNPTRDVQFPGLPPNVVPMVSRTVDTLVTLPNDSVLHVYRSQVMVGYAYGLTDFGSQGLSKCPNPVNLNDIRSHQGFYTALSRSTSADSTIILQPFDSSKLTSGCSQAMTREMRELELLDDITCRRFEGTLPSDVTGTTRKTLIRSFIDNMPQGYVSPHVHPAIRWDEGNPLRFDDCLDSVKWDTGFEKLKQKQASASQSTSLPDNPQRPPKRPADSVDPEPRKKARRIPSNQLSRRGKTVKPPLRLHPTPPDGCFMGSQ
ncbi:hypothetical protein ONZ45_g12679 [Pleurotus djamor]|nr:hypothetical protein ONZ45_g12679 [Pleurotus djamor]